MEFFGNEDQANKNIFIDLDFTTVKRKLHFGISELNRIIHLALQSSHRIPYLHNNIKNYLDT